MGRKNSPRSIQFVQCRHTLKFTNILDDNGKKTSVADTEPNFSIEKIPVPTFLNEYNLTFYVFTMKLVHYTGNSFNVANLTFLEPFMRVSRLMPNECTFSLLEPKPNSLFNIKNKSRSSKTALQRCSRPSSQQKHQGG